jgi:hypothetical protein
MPTQPVFVRYFLIQYSGATFFPITMATAALILGGSGNINCRTVKFPPKTGGDAVIDASAFGYRTKNWAATDDALYVFDTCQSYTVLEEDLGFDYETDQKMEAIQNLTLAIMVIGGLMVIASCVTPCFPLGKVAWKMFGVTFIVMSILQGCTLLVLESNVCLNNPLLQYLEVEFPRIRENYADECEWGTGFKLGISAVVFWFLAGISTLLLPAPVSVADPMMVQDTQEQPAKDDSKPDEQAEIE